MQKIVTESDLRTAILLLESRQAEEARLMKEQFLITVETLKPINLIKSTLMEAAESEDLQENFLNATIGLTAGYLSKVLFQGVSNSPIKKVLGTALMFGIKSLITQNPEFVKTLGNGFFKIIRSLLGSKEKKENIIESQEASAT